LPLPPRRHARPQLNPALRPVWRNETTVQFGLDAERALVIDGIDARRGAVLATLNGALTRAEAIDSAVTLGMSRGDAELLLELLSSAGALVDAAATQGPLVARTATEREQIAPDLAAWSARWQSRERALDTLAKRDASTVAVLGAGRVGATVAGILASAGVGALRIEDSRPMSPAAAAPGGAPASTASTSRAAAALEAARQHAPRLRTPRADAGAPDLVVLCPDVPYVGHELRGRLLADGVAHLLAATHEAVGVVGPLVVPGVTACLQCLDLHRVDRDPAWPLVAAQASGPGRLFDGTPVVKSSDIALATAVAAQAALVALSFLDDATSEESRSLAGSALELRLGWYQWRKRSWPPHPRCGCSWAALAETMAG